MTSSSSPFLDGVGSLDEFTENLKTLEKTPLKNMNHWYSEKAHKVIVEWLFETCNIFKFFDDTIHYAVSYFERFMGVKFVPHSQLTLIASVCLWIAAKFNEIYPPQLNDIIRLLNNICVKTDFDTIVSLECEILCALNFELAKPTVKTFLMDKFDDNETNAKLDKELYKLSGELPSVKATEIRNRKRVRVGNDECMSQDMPCKMRRIHI